MEKKNKEVIDPIEQQALKNALNSYYSNLQNNDPNQTINKSIIDPELKPPVNALKPEQDFTQTTVNKNQVNLDPNLTVGYEIVPLPSKGIYYQNKISEVTVEYMTSKDEDILSTSSLIENGTVLDILLKNKIKTPGINTDDLLVGDRNAILLFLRASSYGQEYTVNVTDPRNGQVFSDKIDLTKLKAKDIKFLPNEMGEFSYELPVRKLLVKFKILNYREINHVLKMSESIQDAYGEQYSQFGSLKLKAEIVEIGGNRNKDYVTQFVDAMPARDSSELKKRITEVTPDVDMNYEFTTTDGFKFKAKIAVGVDFFFPFI